MNAGRAEKLAREHAAWFKKVFASFVEVVFYEAFLHGYKHGFKDAEGLLERSEGERDE